MIEERFKIGKWRLIDIVFSEGICENCQKPITYLYFIEDEKGNKCAVGSECFKQIALRIPPRAKQYIDLKERVLKNIDLIFKNNIQAIDYRRDGIASLAYPDVYVNNRRTGAVYLKITFNSGASQDPRFDVEEETINELLKMGWKEYQEPRGYGGIESKRFILLDPKKAQELEKALVGKGWKVYENPAKKYKIGYYKEQAELGGETGSRSGSLESFVAKENIIKPPRFRVVRLEKLPLEGGAYCDRCGRCIRWVYWLLDTEKSMDEKDAVPVGSECVKIMTGKAPHELKQEWKEHEARVKQNIEELDKIKKAKEWRLVNQDIISGLERLTEGKEHYLPIAENFLDTIAEYGTLTPRQLEFVRSLTGKSVNLIGIDEYNILLEGLFALAMHLRLGRYGSDFIRDVRNRAVDYGFTYKQRDSLVSVLKKYRRQVQEILPRLRDYEKERADKLIEYYKLSELIRIV